MATDPHFEFSTTFDGVTFDLDCRWNEREQAWYFDLLTEDGTPIVRGVKIVLGVMLGGRTGVSNPLFPAGALMAFDLSDEGREATLDDLGTRVVVYFVPTEQLQELES